MKIDVFAVTKNPVTRRADVDVERALLPGEAVARAKCGDPLVIKVWLRTSPGARPDLPALEAAIAAAVAPLGVQ